MSTEVTRAPRFTSVYRHGVDEKRRLQIPSKWRGTGSNELTLFLWPTGFNKDSCLMVFPPAVVDEMVDKMSENPFNHEPTNAMRRFLGERSDTANIDKAGRICVPDWMAKAAGISDEAVLVGLIDRFQIWNPALYEQTRPQNEAVAASVWNSF